MKFAIEADPRKWPIWKQKAVVPTVPVPGKPGTLIALEPHEYAVPAETPKAKVETFTAPEPSTSTPVTLAHVQAMRGEDEFIATIPPHDLEVPAKAEETDMSTAATPAIAVNAATQPAAPAKQNVFQHLLAFVKKEYKILLSDVIKYTPPAEALAEVLFPEYKGLEQAGKNVVVNVATNLQNTVLTMEQKYSDDTAAGESNALKLADTLTLSGPGAIALLGTVGVKADTDRITNAINATVAILKTAPAPAA